MLTFPLISLVCTLAAALLASGYLFGVNRTLGHLIVEAKRRERRQLLELKTVNERFLTRLGVTGINPRPQEAVAPPPSPRKVVSASQKIGELRRDDDMGIPHDAAKSAIRSYDPIANIRAVPAAIRRSFLQQDAENTSA